MNSGFRGAKLAGALVPVASLSFIGIDSKSAPSSQKLRIKSPA